MSGLSGITSLVNFRAEGNSGGVNISTTNLNLTNGGQVAASTEGQGNAGDLTIKSIDSILIDGSIERFRSGISANAVNEDGNGGNISINTGSLTVANGGTIEAANFDNIGTITPGTGLPGNLSITANSIKLTNNARIEAATQSTAGESAEIDFNVSEDITLQESSFISAQAFNNANGGNLNIDSRFIVAFPNKNNDILANAEQGDGGNISIATEGIFGIQERSRNNPLTNDITANSNTGISGDVLITTPDINPVQGATELPTNVVVPEETTQQACKVNREVEAKNGLSITGKGGVRAEPGLPLDSLKVTVDGEANPASDIPAPIETSQGKIQPARGIKVTKSGEIVLTAYRTNNAGNRLLGIKRNCGRV